MSQTRSAQIRASLDHPIVDSDGHLLEFEPALLDSLAQVAGPGMVARYQKAAGDGLLQWGLGDRERRDRRSQALIDGAGIRGDRIDDPYSLDEFAACGIDSAEDVRERFVPSFYFGCEADDPMNALAFDPRINPMGARLHAIFGSDIGHWDVTDARQVVEEAYESVEHGLLSKQDFRAFSFENPVRFWTALNPGFFDGTAIESAARALRAA